MSMILNKIFVVWVNCDEIFILLLFYYYKLNDFDIYYVLDL